MKTEKQIIKFFEMNQNKSAQSIADDLYLASLCHDPLYSIAYREGAADALAWVLDRDAPRAHLDT